MKSSNAHKQPVQLCSAENQRKIITLRHPSTEMLRHDHGLLLTKHPE
jgi:hypothetical protein